MRAHIVPSALLAAGLAISMSACASPTPEENVAAACGAVNRLEAAITTAKDDLQSATDAGDLRTIRDAVRSAYDEADAALGAVAKDRADELASAWTTWKEAVEDVSDDASIDDARASLVEESSALSEARAGIEQSLSCD